MKVDDMVQIRYKIIVAAQEQNKNRGHFQGLRLKERVKWPLKLSPLANIRSQLSLIPTPFPGLTVAQHSRVRDEVGDNFRCYFRYYLSSLTLQRPVRYLRDVHSQGSKDVFTCCHSVDTLCVQNEAETKRTHTHFNLIHYPLPPDIEARSGNFFVTYCFHRRIVQERPKSSLHMWWAFKSVFVGYFAEVRLSVCVYFSVLCHPMHRPKPPFLTVLWL